MRNRPGRNSMDYELIFPLVLLWLSTTFAVLVFLPMVRLLISLASPVQRHFKAVQHDVCIRVQFFLNKGEHFHPHTVPVARRHPMMVIVSGATECKQDCMVASVSAFVAPRGSSTSKFFNTACLAIAISGFFGSLRWYQVKDATYGQFILSAYGHMALLLVAVFEYDGTLHSRHCPHV